METKNVDQLLKDGEADNHQIAEQLVRQSLPSDGKITMGLDLTDTKLTDDILKSITLPDSLTHVNLTRTQITDQGLAHLATGKNIIDVTLIDTRITENGLVHLRAMPNLRTASLHNTDIPAMAQLELLKFLKNRPR